MTYTLWYKGQCPRSCMFGISLTYVRVVNPLCDNPMISVSLVLQAILRESLHTHREWRWISVFVNIIVILNCVVFLPLTNHLYYYSLVIPLCEGYLWLVDDIDDTMMFYWPLPSPWHWTYEDTCPSFTIAHQCNHSFRSITSSRMKSNKSPPLHTPVMVHWTMQCIWAKCWKL